MFKAFNLNTFPLQIYHKASNQNLGLLILIHLIVFSISSLGVLGSYCRNLNHQVVGKQYQLSIVVSVGAALFKSPQHSQYCILS